MTNDQPSMDMLSPSSPPASLYIVCGAAIILFTALVNLLLFQL